MNDPIIMPLVNREKACLKLMETLISQKVSTNHDEILPILSQHYGSGKTRLVAEFRNALKRRDGLESFQRTTNSFEIVNNIMIAALVNLNMTHSALTNSIHDDLKFPNGAFSKFFLFQLELALKRCENNQHVQKTLRIIDSIGSVQLHNKLEIEELEIFNKLISCNTLATFLQIYSHSGLYPLLIHIDEASFLEEHYKDGYMSFVYLWESTLKPTMGSHSGTCTVITPGIYFVVCGTSSNLTKLGRGLLRESNKLISPTPAIHITLDMLKEKHIMEMFEQTIISVNGANVKEFTSICCNVGENYEYFCKVVFIYTMGIPRLIEYTILSLLGNVQSNKNLDFSSKDKIDSIFANFLHGSELDLVRNAKEICPFYSNPTNLSNISRLRAVFTMGVMGFPIPISEEFINEIDLIHDLNVAVEATIIQEEKDNSSSVFKIFIPKFTLIKAAYDNDMKHISVMSSLPHRFYDYLDKGDLLEQLFLDTILTRILFTIKLSQSNKWEEVHTIFSQSHFLKNKEITMNLKEPVTYLPKIVSKINKNTPKALSYSKRHPWRFNISFTYWDKLFDMSNSDIIGHPKSPDLIISIPPCTAISIACKNYNFSSKLTLKMLQEEIDKASLIRKKNVLYVFASQLCETLSESCEELGYLRLTEGTWTFDNKLVFKELAKVPTVSDRAICTTYIPNTINVYPDMEVIILGKRLFGSFFLPADIELLEEISTTKTCPRFNLMERWIGTFYDS